MNAVTNAKADDSNGGETKWRYLGLFIFQCSKQIVNLALQFQWMTMVQTSHLGRHHPESDLYSVVLRPVE